MPNLLAETVLYDPDGTEIGEFQDEGGNQSLVMFGLPNGDYRIVLRGRIDGKGKLKIIAKKGNGDITEIGQEVDLKKHRVMKTILHVNPATGEIVAEEPRPSMKPDGTPLHYDYDGDDDIDINDIEKVEAVWNICRGEGLYDEFFDIDEDGCITVSDIMKVSSEYFVP